MGKFICPKVAGQFICLLLPLYVLGQSAPVFDWESGHRKLLIIHNWSAGLSDSLSTDLSHARAYLKVFRGTLTYEETTRHHSMAGTYQLKNGQLCFQPLISFEQGLTYSAFLGDRYHSQYKAPQKQEGQQTRVLAIYPSTDTLPANLLKMYLHFSAPMSEGKAYQHLTLTTQGDTIPLPFLKLQPELWDSDQQRLTLWLDPGRVKRDLIPNRLLGAPLEKNTPYALHIAQNWQDQQGFSLQTAYAKTFWVKADDRTKPLSSEWLLELPPPHSRSPLIIHLREPMDQALLQKCIRILDARDHILEGQIELVKKESRWTFLPDKPWKKGKYSIRFEARLEDLAGNNLNRLFDVDNQNPEQAPSEEIYFWRRFDL